MKTSVVALLASSLIGCTGPAFEANFNGTDLDCCIVRDTFDPAQAMQEGNSNLAGETSSLGEAAGAVRMVTMPRRGGSAPGDTSTIGIYRTQLSLGSDRTFLIRATFQNPARQLSSDAWTVVLIARTGDAADDPNADRLQISLRTVQDPDAATPVPFTELRVQEGTDAGSAAKLPTIDDPNIKASAPIVGAVFKDVFELQKPFTLSMFVNRDDGVGIASLATESDTIPVTFRMKLFAQKPGEPITTVGAALVNMAPGLPASVEVTHFEILTD